MFDVNFFADTELDCRTCRIRYMLFSPNGTPQEVRVNEGNFLRLPGNDFDQGPPRERGRDR
jgi:hypothetical protein